MLEGTPATSPGEKSSSGLHPVGPFGGALCCDRGRNKVVVTHTGDTGVSNL